MDNRGTGPSRDRRLPCPHASQADESLREADPLIAIAGGEGVNLFNSMGNPWTADYQITGELDVDLRSNIAAEARAKIVYERLINFCNDAGTKDALQFLMTREITHMRAFTAALESLGKPPFVIGRIAPTAGLVDQFFNDSTGEGDQGEIDARGPRNEGDQWEFVEAPAFLEIKTDLPEGPSIHAESSDLMETDAIQELLVDQLRDILHAEKQLVKALPKMAEAARSAQVQRLFEVHLEETEAQVERLNECFDFFGTPARKAVQGHDGARRGGRRGHGGEQEKGRCRSRPRAQRCGATGRALRDVRLHHRAELGAAAAPFGHRAAPEQVARGGGERRSASQSGSPAADVGGKDACSRGLDAGVSRNSSG
jgi:rubrerythrin